MVVLHFGVWLGFIIGEYGWMGYVEKWYAWHGSVTMASIGGMALSLHIWI